VSNEGLASLLPVHGFVLAGGKSSRMGVDKATLMFCGRPMVEIAVEKLRGFCAEVGIAGNREDLARFAPVVGESRVDSGPAVAFETTLAVAECDWSLLIPVDVPLLPAALLRAWTYDVQTNARPGGVCASYLTCGNEAEPAVCLLHRSCAGTITWALDHGERRLLKMFAAIDVNDGPNRRPDGWSPVLAVAAERYVEAVSGALPADVPWWFTNLNSPADMQIAEAWADCGDAGKADLLRG
jgi:molybdopterin-guanine dinucleotide biosynthesis protein A